MPKIYFREWRHFTGLSQAQLATIMGISKPAISRIETGERRWNSEFLEDFQIAVGCGNWFDPLAWAPDPSVNGRQVLPEDEMARRQEFIKGLKMQRETLEKALKAKRSGKRGPRKK